MLRKDLTVEEVFSLAWQQMVAGRSIESALAEYPDHAAELEPMLRLTLSIRDLPAPTLSPDALVDIHRRAQAAAQARQAAHSPTHSPTTLRQSWLAFLFSTLRTNARLIIPIAMAVILVLAGVLFLRAPERQTQLESYSGIITRIAANEWMVGDTAVVIDAQTTIHGVPVVGAKMMCIGENLPGKDRMRAVEVWVGMEPSPPLTLPTRSHDEGSSLTGRSLSSTQQK